MRYVVVENEEYSRNNLLKMVAGLRPDSICVFTAETVEDAVNLFQQASDVDLIFMDIELDDGTCFEIFERVDIEKPVIFTTAYSEYAIKAFKVNSIDYLLKPIVENDLLKSIEKYESRIGINDRKDYRELGTQLNGNTYKKRLLISDGNGYSYVQTDDIAWLEADNKYVSIVLLDGKSILTDFKSLGDVVKILDPESFYQISRGVVASINSIEKVSKYFKSRLVVKLKAGKLEKSETISSARRAHFLEWLGHQ